MPAGEVGEGDAAPVVVVAPLHEGAELAEGVFHGAGGEVAGGKVLSIFFKHGRIVWRRSRGGGF